MIRVKIWERQNPPSTYGAWVPAVPRVGEFIRSREHPDDFVKVVEVQYSINPGSRAARKSEATWGVIDVILETCLRPGTRLSCS